MVDFSEQAVRMVKRDFTVVVDGEQMPFSEYLRRYPVPRDGRLFGPFNCRCALVEK